MKHFIKKEEVRNILITRTDRLGDVILTLPLISEARRIFKGSRVFFLVKRYVAELVSGYEGIDEVVAEEDHTGFAGKYKFFKRKNIDLVINVKPEFDLALLFFLLRIKYRIGTGYRWFSFLYNMRVYEHRKTSERHESDYNLSLLKNFFDEVSFEKNFYFKYSKEEKALLNNKLSRFGLNTEDNFIIIHPGSGGSAKDLPLSRLSDFARKFSSGSCSFKIAFTGLENEKTSVESIRKNVPESTRSLTVDLTGQLNLRELMILIDSSKLFISNSTGPVHIAGALNKNIIGFYPNEIPMNEKRWRPHGSNVTILTPGKEKSEMDSISTEEIISAAEKYLK